MDEIAEKEDTEIFSDIKQIKQGLTPETLCCRDNLKPLIPFITEVNNLSFDEQPDYNKLKFMLVKILLDQDELPKRDLIPK